MTKYLERTVSYLSPELVHIYCVKINMRRRAGESYQQTNINIKRLHAGSRERGGVNKQYYFFSEPQSFPSQVRTILNVIRCKYKHKY